MPNAYISTFNDSRAISTRYSTPVIAALEALKTARERWLESNTRWRGGFWGLKLFFNPETTRTNLEVINKLLVELEQIEKYETSNPPADVTEIVQRTIEALQIARAYLSEGGHTKELLDHVIENYEPLVRSNPPPPKLTGQPIQEAPDEKIEVREEEVNVSAMLTRKNLDENLFASHKDKIDLKDPISKHAAWVFRNIYSVPYSSGQDYLLVTQGKIGRYKHGISHVSRVAYYIRVIANLYIKFGDVNARALTDEDIKLLQIAALFHDAAREGDGEDRWDAESAVMLYKYLKNVLHVDSKKAALFAEAIANKDINEEGYYALKERGRKIYWETQSIKPPKNSLQMILHDADSWDIIRAEVFDARFLDFYKVVVMKNPNKPNETALDEMALLTTEVRSLIDVNGDSRNETNHAVKHTYDDEKCYDQICADVKTHEYVMLSTLYNDNQPMSSSALATMSFVDTTPFDPSKGITDENPKNLEAGLREGKIFARGIGAPSAISVKPWNGEDESLAHLELRKAMREPGVRTTTSKADGESKSGNPLRSVAMLGHGAGVFTNAGFLLIAKPERVKAVSAVDFSSGRGKKAETRNQIGPVDSEAIKKALEELHAKLKLGGAAVGDKEFAANHCEILYDISHLDFKVIFYSNDPNLFNHNIMRKAVATHIYSPVLQALFLRRAYFLKTGKQLPIVEYSGVHNRISVKPPFSDQEIIRMWVEMASVYIDKQLKIPFSPIHTMSVDDIKIDSMYAVNSLFPVPNTKYIAPADANYEESLRSQISAAIERERAKQIAEHEKMVMNKLKKGELDLLSTDVISAFKFNPSLLASVPRDQIESVINKSMQDLFNKPTNLLPHSVTLLWKFIFDRASCIKRNREEYGLNALYDLEAFKLYELIKLSGLKQYAQLFRERVVTYVKTNISNNMSHDNLERMILISKLFDIDDEIKDTMTVAIKIFADKLIDELKKDKSYQALHNLGSLLRLLAESALLAPDILTRAKQAFIDTEGTIKISEDKRKIEWQLEEYLQLADLLEIPAADQKPFILTLLSKFRFYKQWGPSVALDALIHHDFYNDEDIFNRLVDSIALNGGLGFDYSIFIPDYMRNLVAFLKLNPNQAFTEKQIAYINASMNDVAIRYLKEETSRYHAFNWLLRGLDEFHKANIPLPFQIPSALIERYKSTVINADPSKLRPEELSFAIKLHKEIPALNNDDTVNEKINVFAKILEKAESASTARRVP